MFFFILKVSTQLKISWFFSRDNWNVVIESRKISRAGVLGVKKSAPHYIDAEPNKPKDRSGGVSQLDSVNAVVVMRIFVSTWVMRVSFTVKSGLIFMTPEGSLPLPQPPLCRQYAARLVSRLTSHCVFLSPFLPHSLCAHHFTPFRPPSSHPTYVRLRSLVDSSFGCNYFYALSQTRRFGHVYLCMLAYRGHRDGSSRNKSAPGSMHWCCSLKIYVRIYSFKFVHVLPNWFLFLTTIHSSQFFFLILREYVFIKSREHLQEIIRLSKTGL